MPDQHLTDLTEETSPDGTDLVFVVADPGGTPLNRKVQIGNLADTIATDPAFTGTYQPLVTGLDATGAVDGTSLIQAALNAGPGTVTLPPNGTFKVNTTATLTNPHGVTLDLNGSTLNNANTGGLACLTTAAAVRRVVIQNGAITGVAGSGACIKLTANFGGVQLRSLILNPVAGASGVDWTAGDGIDLYMQDVRVDAATGVTCFAGSAASSVNTVTANNCYASSGAIGFDLYNVSAATLIGCSADNTTSAAYQLGGTVDLIRCTCEAGTGKGLYVVGVGTMRIELRAGSQADPFFINAAADVDLVSIVDTSTPSTNSLTLGASATGAIKLYQGSFSKLLSITAAANLQRLDKAVTAASIQQAVVATSEASTSSSYADLATAGPAVSAWVGVSGVAIVVIAAKAENASAGGINLIGVAVSGATTVAAADSAALWITSGAAGHRFSVSNVVYLTGLTPGLNTFTLKYRVAVNNGTVENRRIIVIPV